MNFKSFLLLFSFCFLVLFSCKKEPKKQETHTLPSIERPSFNADSAYQFVQHQVNFGPRVPESEAHLKAVNWLVEKLGTYADTAFVQTGEATMYNGNTVPIKNIIGSFNPSNTRRILLAAHYDSRHVADKDDELKDKPILGANDGASGVGVLLEIARQLQKNNSNLGIDIIFFDAEDQGSPSGSENYKVDSWCLGSQYWGQNPHIPNYRASYGILLDMVGAQDAVFQFERMAYQKAAPLYTKTWNTAIQLGYDYLFQKKVGGGITDDHVYVMKYRGFPMINIIDHDVSKGGFGSFHHTHNDNMSIIDPATLQAVGEVVLAVLNG